MRKRNIENLAETIGKGLRVNENKKNLKARENTFLVETANVSNSVGINVFEFEEKYVTIVKNLLMEVYGEVKSQIIIWWVYESISPGGDEIMPLVDEKEKEHIIKTPKQLVRFLKRYDGK